MDPESHARAEHLEHLRELAREAGWLLDEREPSSGPLLEEPVIETPPAILEPGTRVGPYEIRGVVGTGGMGVVFRASRVDGAFEKEVAIKLVKGGTLPGTRRPDLMRRFLAERQILARLEHPYIARLLDGGATQDGSPFFVMELVDGLPIDRFCIEHELSIGARVDLIVRVCQAVRYAHDRFIAHRDIKPTNILVARGGDREPVPKLLDFGLARLLRQNPLAEGSPGPVSSGGLTPSYASPEQFRNEAVTAASDVYSLGVILFQLLTGAMPYDLAKLAPHEIARRVCEDPPLRPSDLVTRLRGDLETIVLKALEKDPARRYANAATLMDDLVRWREIRPVLARPSSRGYRLRKAIARRKLAYGLGALVFLTAVTSTVWISLLFTQARAAERVAEERRLRAERTLSLFHELFTSTDPYRGGTRGRTVAEVLGGAGSAMLDRLEGEPEIRGRLRRMIGSTYEGLGEREKADEYLGAAVADLEASMGSSAIDTLTARLDWARVLRARNRYDLAKRQVELVLATLAHGATAQPAVFAAAKTSLAECLFFMGEAGEAKRSLGEILGDLTASDAIPPLTRARGLALMASIHLEDQEYDRARELYHEALAIQERVCGGDHPYALETRSELASVDALAGRPEEAAEELERIFQAFSNELGPSHPSTIWALGNLGVTWGKAGEHDLAEAALRDALDAAEQTLGPESHDTLVIMNCLATVLGAAGRAEEAEPLLRESYEGLVTRAGTTHPYALGALFHYANFLVRRGRLQDAIDCLEPQILASRAVLQASSRGRALIEMYEKLRPAQDEPDELR